MMKLFSNSAALADSAADTGHAWEQQKQDSMGSLRWKDLVREKSFTAYLWKQCLFRG